MELPQPIKEYEDVYYKIVRIIDSCDTIPQLEFCGDNLIKIFRKGKFKRDKPKKKELNSLTLQLIDTIRKKRQSIRFRIHHQKKKETII